MHALASQDAADGVWSPRTQYNHASFQTLSGTELHQLIDRMPKGTMLHCHRSACFNFSEVVYQIAEMNPSWANTYGPQVYIYNFTGGGADGRRRYMHGDVLCPNEATTHGATLLQDANLDEVIAYWSLENLNMFQMTDDQIWDEFELRFALPRRVWRWLPVARDLIMPSLVNDAIRHGISYLEPIGSLGNTWTKNCTAAGDNDEAGYSRDRSGAEEVAMWDTYMGTLNGDVHVNLIGSPWRGAGDMMAELDKYLALWRSTANNANTKVVAFDLVGREDRYGLADEMTDMWVKAEQEGIPVAPHAGETIYPIALPTPFKPKSPANNMFVHILYSNTIRVGHGLALAALEPEVAKEYMRRNITVVTTPVSNQLLGYVQSSLFHQACELAQMGVKIALSHDDAPIFSRFHSVSHDFGYIYRSCRTCGHGLALLKEMIINGWDSAVLTPAMKDTKYNQWMDAWNSWVATEKSRICALASPPAGCNGTEAMPPVACHAGSTTCRDIKKFYKSNTCCTTPNKVVSGRIP